MANEPFMLVSLKGDKARKLAQVMSNPTCTKILEYLAGKDATETKIAEDLKVPLSTVHYNLQQLVAAKLVVVDEFHYSEKGREINHYKLAKKYIIIAPEDDDPTFLAKLKKFIPVTILTLGLAAILKTMQFFTGTNDATAMNAQYTVPIMDKAVGETADKAARGVMEGVGASRAVEIAADTAAGSAPAMKAMALEATNETINETANNTANAAMSTAQAMPVDYAAQPLLDEAVRQEMTRQAINDPTSSAAQQVVPPAHWWQSPVMDWFIAGAIFVLVVLVISEAISYWRNKK